MMKATGKEYHHHKASETLQYDSAPGADSKYLQQCTVDPSMCCLHVGQCFEAALCRSRRRAAPLGATGPAHWKAKI